VATMAQALNLVDALESELIRRRGEMDRNEDCYRGNQPLRFASDEFRKFHGERYRDFSDNWVQPVADAPVERLTVRGFRIPGEESADAEFWRVWQENGLDADSQLGFLSAGINARSFMLVWGNPDDEENPEVTFEDASQCIVVYEPGSRRKRRAALKRWQDGAKEFATLYLPREVWKFARPLQRQEKSPQLVYVDEEMRSWAPRESDTEPNPQPNPMGVVPMVELPNKPMLVSEPISDVSGVVAMQDSINLLWAYLFTASDYASFPQRVIIGAEVPKVPVLNSAGQVVGSKPVDLGKFAVDRVLFLEGRAGETKIAEWQAANLGAYTDVIEVAVGHIAAQTRTPQHYLVGRMANLSGDALLAAETGLVKKAEEKHTWYGQGLREGASLIALAQGNEAKARAIRSGSVMWADVESRSHAQMADALVKLKSIGFPFEWIALRYGLTPTEVADVIAMRQRESDMDPVQAIAHELGRGGPPRALEPADADVEEEEAPAEVTP